MPLSFPLRLLKRQFPFSLSSSSPPDPGTSDAPSRRGRSGLQSRARTPAPGGRAGARGGLGAPPPPPRPAGSGRGTPAAPSRAAHTRTHTLLPAPPCSGRRRQPSPGSGGRGCPAESSRTAPARLAAPGRAAAPRDSWRGGGGRGGPAPGPLTACHCQASGAAGRAWPGRAARDRVGRARPLPCSREGGREQRRTEGSPPKRRGRGSKPRPSFLLASRHAPLTLTDPRHDRRRRVYPLNECLGVAVAIVVFVAAATATNAAEAGLENISGLRPSLTTASSLPGQRRPAIGCNAGTWLRGHGTGGVTAPPPAPARPFRRPLPATPPLFQFYGEASRATGWRSRKVPSERRRGCRPELLSSCSALLPPHPGVAISLHRHRAENRGGT